MIPMIKKIFIFFSIFHLLFFNLAYSKTVDLYFFWAHDCPYSTQMALKLQEIQTQFPELKINALEVLYNPQNQKLMRALAEIYKVRIDNVPVIFVGNLAVQGAGSNQVLQIKEEIRRCSISGCPSPIEKIKTVPAKQFNFKNITLLFGGLIIFFIIFISVLKKKK